MSSRSTHPVNMTPPPRASTAAPPRGSRSRWVGSGPTRRRARGRSSPSAAQARRGRQRRPGALDAPPQRPPEEPTDRSHDERVVVHKQDRSPLVSHLPPPGRRIGGRPNRSQLPPGLAREEQHAPELHRGASRERIGGASARISVYPERPRQRAPDEPAAGEGGASQARVVGGGKMPRAHALGPRVGSYWSSLRASASARLSLNAGSRGEHASAPSYGLA